MEQAAVRAMPAQSAPPHHDNAGSALMYRIQVINETAHALQRNMGSGWHTVELYGAHESAWQALTQHLAAEAQAFEARSGGKKKT